MEQQAAVKEAKKGKQSYHSRLADISNKVGRIAL